LREIFGKDKIVTIKGRGYKFVGWKKNTF
jgi:DNA-binding winged helix-turn-helix (wHTH) protein